MAVGSKAYMPYVVSLARAKRASGVTARNIPKSAGAKLTSLSTSTEHGDGWRRLDEKGVGVA